MSKVGKWKSGKPHPQQNALEDKNNCEKTCTIRKLFVPLQQVARMTFGSEICGVTGQQIFLSARESVP